MMEKIPYLFRSERLGFRVWSEEDIPKLSLINSDPNVMQFFPAIQSELQTREFVNRMNRQFIEKGFCYFAVDKLSTGEFIGFIGISEQYYPAEFTPCIDIGWRIMYQEWNQGFATEGATRCLEYVFDEFKIERIFAVAPIINKKSESIMIKLGMSKVMTFQHNLLMNYPALRDCLVYEMRNPVYEKS